MYRHIFILALTLLLVTAGCLAPQQTERPDLTPALTQSAPVPLTVFTTVPATQTPVLSTITPTVPPTFRTATPHPTSTPLSGEALNTRIVDARNKLNNLIESDVADTIIIHSSESPGCELKQSRELGYLIDATTGESVFVKGDYGSIDADLFKNPMQKDHEYVIIHTHPRMWATCRGSGIVSLYTFSIGDLEAAAALNEQGYKIRYIIAISDKEYRIWPKVPGDWKSPAEIRAAITRIEQRYEIPFTYYDPMFEKEYFEVDNLMPLLAKELDYSYTANNDVMA